MKIKLTEEDKKILSKWEEEKYFEQIERALNKTIYTLIDNFKGIEEKINSEKARKLLGNKDFLSGLDRSAFHRTAAREIANTKKYIYFDTSKLFEN